MIAVRSMSLATAAIVVGLSFATSAEAQFRGGFGRGGLGGGFARGGGFAGTRFGAVPRFGGVGRGAFGPGFARRGGLGFAGPGRGFRPAFARGRFGAGWRGRGFVARGGGFDASDGIGIGLAILGTLLSQ